MHNGSENTAQNDSKHLAKETDREIDEYELYYGENAINEIHEYKHDQPGPLSRRPLYSSAIPVFILSFLFVLCTCISNNSSFSDYLWASRETVFTKHEYWRLLTAIFTHTDAVHLLSNMMLFFFFGLFLYEYFGIIVFPILPLII